MKEEHYPLQPKGWFMAAQYPVPRMTNLLECDYWNVKYWHGDWVDIWYWPTTTPTTNQYQLYEPLTKTLNEPSAEQQIGSTECWTIFWPTTNTKAWKGYGTTKKTSYGGFL